MTGTHTGFVIIARDEKRIRARFPAAERLFPYMWFVPMPEGPASVTAELLRWVVGGHIELVPYRCNMMTIYCNEEGKNEGLQPCVWQPSDYVHDFLAGDLALLGPVDEIGNETLLTLEEAHRLLFEVVPSWASATLIAETLADQGG